MPGGFGWHNPWPLELGGGETLDESIYEMLKRAVGEGGYAKNEEGIEGLWRAVRTQALASLASDAERAILQAFPNVATDHIPVYEELFRITPRGDEPDEERRHAITAAYTRQIKPDHPSLVISLQNLDARFSIPDVPHATSLVVELGKAFQPAQGGPFFGGGRTCTLFPNYATEYIVPVVLDLTATPTPSQAELIIVQQAKRFLNEVLASWMHYTFSFAGTAGFILDDSELDATGLTPT